MNNALPNQINAESKGCRACIDDNKNLNFSQNTIAMWAVSNERQHEGLGVDFVLHTLIHASLAFTLSQDLAVCKHKEKPPPTAHWLMGGYLMFPATGALGR